MNEVIRMHELNSELLRTLILVGYKIRNYSDINNLHLLGNNFYSLLRKAELLTKEIGSDLPNFQKSPIRRNFTRRKSDKDFTEPCRVKLILIDDTKTLGYEGDLYEEARDFHNLDLTNSSILGRSVFAASEASAADGISLMLS